MKCIGLVCVRVCVRACAYACACVACVCACVCVCLVRACARVCITITYQESNIIETRVMISSESVVIHKANQHDGDYEA